MGSLIHFPLTMLLQSRSGFCSWLSVQQLSHFLGAHFLLFSPFPRSHPALACSVPSKGHKHPPNVEDSRYRGAIRVVIGTEYTQTTNTPDLLPLRCEMVKRKEERLAAVKLN